MKKILLLVSALLIACMAGSATASIMDMESKSIVVTPGSSETIDLVINTEGYSQDDYSLTLMVSQAADAVSAEIIDSSHSGLLNLGPVDFASSSVSNPVTIDGDQIVTAKVKITRNQNTDQATVTVKLDNEAQTLHVEASETVLVNAPEFPTLAAPIAGILGLLFIFGRKKEEL